MKGKKIEFEPGEVIKPEFDPENNLVAVYVNDAGLDSLRESVCPEPESGDDREEVAVEYAGEELDEGVIDLGMVRVVYSVRVPPDISNR